MRSEVCEKLVTGGRRFFESGTGGRVALSCVVPSWYSFNSPAAPAGTWKRVTEESSTFRVGIAGSRCYIAAVTVFRSAVTILLKFIHSAVKN